MRLLECTKYVLPLLASHLGFWNDGRARSGLHDGRLPLSGGFGARWTAGQSQIESEPTALAKDDGPLKTD